MLFRSDDDLARDLGFDDLPALRARATEDIERRLQIEAEQNVEAQLMQQLRDANPVDVPESLIEHRLDDMTRRFATDIANQGIDPHEAVDWAAFRRDSRDRASASVAEEMLLDAIADSEGLVVDDDAVTAEIRDQHARREGGKTGPLPALIQQMRKDGSYGTLRLVMVRRKALEHLKARATIDTDGGENASAARVSGEET